MAAPGPIITAFQRLLRWWRTLSVWQVMVGSAVAVIAALLLEATLHTGEADPTKLSSSQENIAFRNSVLTEHAILQDREEQLEHALRLAALSQEKIKSVAEGEPGWDLGKVLGLTGNERPPTTPQSRLEALTEAVRKARDNTPRLKELAEAQRRHTSTLDRQLELLKDGNVAFNVPEDAKVAKAAPIEAKVHPTLPATELIKQVEQSGRVDTAPLKISDRMIATLTGGAAFDVSSCSPVEQAVADRETTTWCWVITPKIGGKQVLVLSFDAVMSISGQDSKRSIKTFTRRIDVDVGWPETLGEWLELAKKTGENISYLWAGILVPIGGAVWAFVSHRRRPIKAVVGNQPPKKRRRK
jgi:hypothetical protein